MDYRKIVNIGNSYYVNISEVHMLRLGLKPRDYVTVELTEKGLLVKPLKITEEGKHEKQTSDN